MSWTRPAPPAQAAAPCSTRRGTGSGRAEKFFGVTLADEKDVVYIVARSEEKAAIMKAIKGKRRPRHPRGRHLLLAPDLLGRGPAQRRINKKTAENMK